MDIRVRPFSSADAVSVSALFADYMREAYGQPNAMTADVLRRDAGQQFELVVGVDDRDHPVGFAAWRETYDLHNAIGGGEIPDLYVSPAWRGRLVAVRLVAAIGRAVLAKGGRYLRAEVLAGIPGRMARRMTVGFPAETVYLSGRGLRQLAALLDSGPRELVIGLPTADASRDP